jgi:peptidoglycan/LPS O-acetylase OafA/YrhL
VLYAGNYFLIFQNFHGMPAGLGVIWSLAIEEHFYLFFPPIAAALLRLRQRRVTLCLLGGLVLLVLAWRLWLASLQAPPTYIDMATDTRIDAILIGCLMALAWNPWLDPVPALGNRGVGWILLSSLGVLGGTLFFRDLFFRETLRYSLQGLAIAPLIYASIARPDLLAFRWLNSRPIAYLGSISYTAYLAHHVILLGIERHWPQSGWTLRLFGAAALTLGVAALIRASVETPLLGLRGRLRGERQSPSAAGTALRTVGQT